MKKSIFFLFLFVLFAIPFASSLEANLKQEYLPGETFMAEISGNFIDNIQPADILFYSGRAYIATIYDVGKINDRFYIYSVLPDKERNYTMVIKNAHFYEMGEEKKQDLSYNFSVKGALADFSVTPGFVITNTNFSIQIESNYKDLDVTASFLNSTQTISVQAMESKTINFLISDIHQPSVNELNLSSGNLTYTIPVYVLIPSEKVNETEVSFITNPLRFSKSEYNFFAVNGSTFNFEISILNKGNNNITDLALELIDLDEFELNATEISAIAAGKSAKVTLSVLSKETGIREGTLKVTSENYTIFAPISINIYENQTELKQLANVTEMSQEGTCASLKGNFCNSNLNETCNGEYQYTSDYNGTICCVGACQAPSTGGSGKWIALLAIIIFLLLILLLVYRKLKLRLKTPKEVLGEKEKEYEERFKPKEVRGGLSRV